MWTPICWDAKGNTDSGTVIVFNLVIAVHPAAIPLNAGDMQAPAEPLQQLGETILGALVGFDGEMEKNLRERHDPFP